ncbi:MAG: hypothetical protein Q9206_006751, partial [Seirophora lacunosa]
MARVPAKRAAAAPVRTGALRHARTNEQRKSSYKVVIEEITEKKKKLHTTVSFRTQAPLGYTFVAAGDPRLTSKCKDIARAQSLTVYIVSGTRQQPQRGSHRATRSAHNKNDQITKPRAASVGNDMDQSEIDARAAFAIRDLFPKIPERDVQLIVAQAFQKGTNKVGTAFDQPHIRRVHLAVGAYIRHSYTDYDKLLKTHGYFEARHMVEPFTLDKIIEWRDEKDDPDAVEDILREVIVISDDEDEDLSEEGHFGDRDSSVEIASSREISNEVHVQPIDYGTLDGRSRLERPVSPEDDWAPSVRFIRRLSTPPAESKQQQDRIARHHAQRYQKWQDAISRSRRKDMENTGHSRMAEPIGFTGPGPPPAIHRIREPIMVDHDGNGYPPGFTDSKAASRQDAFRRTTLHIPHTDGMNRVSRSSLVVCHHVLLRETDPPKKPRGNVEGSWTRLERSDIQNVPTYDGATNVSWPAYHTNHTEDRNGDNKLLPYRPSGAIPRSSSIAGPVYLDSERLIPSVESDSPTALMHKDYLTNSRPAAPQRHFQDHMIGPRVVEIDDDPLSPTHKRRRIADDGSSPAKASMAKTQKLTSRPPVQDKQHSSNVLSHPLSSKLDCPFAIQGSFCDRLRQNGFSTPDHLNEHLRKVHLWDMQKTRGLDDVRASDLSHNPLGSHVASQNSYVHAERMHTDPRAGWRTDTYPKTNREQEAIYVSSSPLVEE